MSTQERIDKIYNEFERDFFESLEQKFLCRVKIEPLVINLNLILILTGVFTFFFFGPGAFTTDTDWYENLFHFFKPILGFDGLQYTRFLGWITGVIVFSPFFVFVVLASIRLKLKERKYALSRSYMIFCSIFYASKNLKHYLINEDPRHLKGILQQIYPCLDNLMFATIGDKDVWLVELNETMDEFSNVEFSKESKYFIESMDCLYDTIEENVEKKKDLDFTLLLLKALATYEYVKLYESEKLPKRIKVDLSCDEVITYISKSVEGLGSYSEEKEEKKNAPQKQGKSKVKKLLFSNSITLMFISWYVLLSVIFFTIGIISTILAGVNVDSTIIVGIITAPFLGAVTIATAIYSKRKN